MLYMYLHFVLIQDLSGHVNCSGVSESLVIINAKWVRNIMERTSYIRWNDDLPFVIDQHSLVDLYSATSLKKTVRR